MRKLLLIGMMALSQCAAPAAAETMRDGSSTIAAGGVSQVVFGDNAARRYLSCQNPLDATEKLAVNIDGPASTSAASFELAAGGSITFGPILYGGAIPTGPVTVTAATSGHRFVCKQF